MPGASNNLQPAIEWFAKQGLYAQIGAWRASCSKIDIIIVRGNHDRRAGDPPPA